MTEAVERVARAIRDNIAAALPGGVTVDYEYAARAAIEAMREPAETMKSAAHKWADGGCGCPCCFNAILAWPAMIDAALTHAQPPAAS